MVIYAIKHKKTGNMYIGQTIQDNIKRWRRHRNDLKAGRHKNAHLQNAWDKYGEEAFVFEVIDKTAENQDQLNALETFYVTTGGYYNLRSGGAQGRHNVETKKKISESLKGRLPWNAGKINVYSEESNRKRSETQKGRISPMKGKKHSEESKKKISESQREYWANVPRNGGV